MNVLVTGGASGLGEAITIKLASDPANRVYFTYCHSAKKAKELEQKFPNAKALKCDFLITSEIDALVQNFTENKIECLINNALTGLTKGYFHKTEIGDYASSFHKNVVPVLLITQAAIRHFRKQKNGRIITILSDYLIGTPRIGLSGYTAEKAYLLSLSKSWASENKGFNITANCISPSFMLTSLTADTDERTIEEMIVKHPLKKLLKADEVASAVSFFLSASQQLNGANLVINAAQNVL